MSDTASVLDAATLQACLNCLRKNQQMQAMELLRHSDSKFRSKKSQCSDTSRPVEQACDSDVSLPQIFILQAIQAGCAAQTVEILTSDLLLCTSLTACRLESMAGVITLPECGEITSEALSALAQLLEGKAGHVHCTAAMLPCLVQVCYI